MNVTEKIYILQLCNGVKPYLSFAFTSALFFIKYRAMSPNLTFKYILE
jgi:hypothetical protein